MKKVTIGLIALISIVFVAWFLADYFSHEDVEEIETVATTLPQDYASVTFTISGVPVTLVDGVATATTNLGGASVTTVRYFGNEVTHDIDGDGDEDVAFLVTQETGGSGTFFYLVAAIKEPGGYTGSQAMYIGDRIAPQTTERGEGTLIIVNYADRAYGEPMTTPPSHGKSLWALYDVDTKGFGELVQDFEGEAR